LLYERKKILITVKTYPNPSRKYGETVCCAGIDLAKNQWIRLYPIPYRDLDDESKFQKYSIIEVDCAKQNIDHRPESYRPKICTIRKHEWLDPKANWAKRKAFVLRLPALSMCQVSKESRLERPSLALIKPERVSFQAEKQTPPNRRSRDASYKQLSLFNKQKKPLEQIPYEFYFNFFCKDEPSCQGHRLSIIDWEIVQAFRKWRWKYHSDEEVLKKIKQRWEENTNTAKKDVYFYVGNMKRLPDTFMVLGVFYPPVANR